VPICLQDRSGAFDPLICEKAKTLSEKIGNVFVTATKQESCRKKETCKQFLDNVIKLYVKNDKSMLFLDSLGGQTHPSLYDEKFVYENNEPICSVKIILPKCIPTRQPCDVYF
jgi:hypothetical protein